MGWGEGLDAREGGQVDLGRVLCPLPCVGMGQGKKGRCGATSKADSGGRNWHHLMTPEGPRGVVNC